MECVVELCRRTRFHLVAVGWQRCLRRQTPWVRRGGSFGFCSLTFPLFLSLKKQTNKCGASSIHYTPSGSPRVQFLSVHGRQGPRALVVDRTEADDGGLDVDFDPAPDISQGSHRRDGRRRLFLVSQDKFAMQTPAGDVGTIPDQEVHAIAVDPVLTTSTDPDSFLESHTEFFEQCPSRGARSRARAISTEDDTSSGALSISSQFS